MSRKKQETQTMANKKPTDLITDEGELKRRQGEVKYERINKETLKEVVNQDTSWDDLMSMLHSHGIATVADAPALTLLKNTWDGYQRAVVKCKEEGEYIYTQTGYAQLAPWAAQVNKLREQCMKILREFGLTPSSRSGLKARETGGKDPNNLLDI